MGRCGRLFVYVLHLLWAAVHLPQVFSSGSLNVDIVTNSSDFETAGHVLYDFAGDQSTNYRLIFNSGCPNDTFSIEPIGELMIAQPVEFSTEDLEPECVSTSIGYVKSIRTYSCFAVIENLSQSYGILMVINVIPNLPSTQIKFPQEFYPVEIMEGVQGTAILNGGGIQAITLPVDNLLIPSYRMLSGHSSFTLSEHIVMCDKFLQMYATQALNREGQAYYEITVEAYASQVSTNTTIQIHVLDKNDNGPELLSPPQNATVSNNLLQIGETVTQFQAKDEDSGLNARLSYSLTTLSSPFSVNPFTGSLFRYSSQNIAQTMLTVRISDSGNPHHENLTNISIFTESDHQHSPDIHDLGSVVASEGDSINSVVSTILITYLPSRDLIVGVESFDCNCFKLSNTLENTQGEYQVNLLINSPLDHETFPNGVNITITAEDADNSAHATIKQFIVTISDENETPLFPLDNYEVSVFEGTPIGSEIFRLAAVDPDSGLNGEITYTYTSAPQTIPISLNEGNGIIRIENDIDYVSITRIELMVTAEDGGGETDSTTLVITILDRNDQKPSFANSELTVTISETILANESIFHFSASDGDLKCNGAISYSIVHAEPPVFQIDPVSGLLYPLNDNSIDYEQFKNATLTVRASDLGADSVEFADASLLVIIRDINDERPKMGKIQCPCFMMETSSSTQNCQPLSAYDADSTNLVFSIQSGNEQNKFEINSQTGVVSTSEELSYEEKATYTLEIIASDGEFSSDSETLNIIIVDRNDHIPEYPNSQIMITSPIDTPIGSLVGDVSAKHNDAGYNALTEYNLLPSDDVLKLDSLSGFLYLKSSPQTETPYTFSVTATDLLNEVNIASASVTVTFAGEHNNAPHFRSPIDHINIASNSLTATDLYHLIADDDDEGVNGFVTYSLTSPSDIFELHEDALRLSQSLSNQVGSEFALSILASDGGSPSLNDSLQLLITVYDSSLDISGQIFQHNPGLSVQHDFANISEETSTSFHVTDLPPMFDGDVVQYLILPQGEFYNAFTIQDGYNVLSEAGNQNLFNRMQNEAVFITIRAQYGSNFHHYSLTVVIDDKNNNGPQFEQDEYSVEIYRKTPQGAYIFEFNAHDPDIGSNAITRYEINPNSSTFAIVPNTGFLEVVGELTESVYSLTIVATDSQSSDLPSSTTTLKIYILESTNSPPSINPATYSVSENAGVGDIVGSLTISDEDIGMHGSNTICFASGDVNSHFRVNQVGQITIQNQLDFEKIPSFTLTVMGYDSSPNPASSTTQITVTVEDENENPNFSAEVYFATTVENNPPMTPVLNVTAFDADSGTAGVIRYSLLNATDVFSINPMTGEVTTLSILNRESIPLHSFTVAATDGGELTSTAFVQVSVLDVNDNDPVFISPNTITVNEDTPVGDEVTQLQAMDKDKGGNSSVYFEIVGGNEAHIFSLDSFSGSVTLNRLLDFETDTQSIQLSFKVSDSLHTSTQEATFSIKNVNDNFPIFSFSHYTCSILEGANDFILPCQVTATDADKSDDIDYEISSGNIAGAFQINRQTGIITRQVELNREVVSSYVLKVKATDSGIPSLSSYTIVLVEVKDDNDNVPMFDPTHVHESSSILSQLFFSELLPRNTLIFFAHAVDNDIEENGEISYHITSGDTDLFQIDSNTSAIFLTGTFDFEYAKNHELMVEATNPSGTSTSHVYTINILNDNENLFPPVFSTDSVPAITISEIASVGTHLTNINATDADPGPAGEVRYYITGGSGYGYFDISQLHGDISVIYTLSGIGTSAVTLEIMAKDLGNPPLSSSFNLLVILEPDPGAEPFFVSVQFAAFASELFSDVGKVFTSVQALINGRPSFDVSYCIVSGNDDNRFSINSSTSAISSVSNLDRETESLYTLIVNASRTSSTIASLSLVAITVADSNDFTPSFDHGFDVTIFNNHPTGTNNAFMRVFAVDEDIGQNGRLMYTISSDTSSIFDIDSSNGDIYLTESLPTSGTPSYEISVSVTDMGSLPLTQSTTFTVSVTSPTSTLNNLAPSFTSSSTGVEISEDAQPGLLVYTAQANDSPGDHLVYQITEPLPHFAIMPNSGKVYLIKSLDREEESQHTIRIQASDGSLSSSTFLLNVVVTDVNDNRPIFTTEEFVFTVAEHSMNETLVGHLTANDIDDANSITYTLVDSRHPSSIKLFSLSSNGTLKVAGSINRELRPVHFLTVAAEDDGSPPLMSYALVKVMVTDINDHVPEFISPLQNISISENITIGTPFFNISVFDPDIGLQGSFSYYLMPNTVPFAINESTGELYVASALDAEHQISYSLVISVADQDNPSMTATTTLQITVANELDSVPILNNPGTITIPENEPPYTFVAFVGDSNSLSSVHYDIISGNDENNFFVEPLTGIIRTAVPLDRENVSSYNLTVQGAFDQNHKTSIFFTVLVGDENDNAPLFTNYFLEYTLPEDSAISSPLVRLNFTDKDQGSNAQIGEFFIPDAEAAKIFSVDSSGNLQILQSLDREGKFDAIKFELYIFDSGNPPLHDLAQLSITISDVNDNPPYFLEPSYMFTVSLPVVVDTILFGVEAADLDEASTIRYMITGGNGTDKFSINAITGGISVTDNYRMQPYYSLTVLANDGGGGESSVSVTIAAKECGFSYLLFHPRDVSKIFSENITITTVIFQPYLLQFNQPGTFKFSFSTVDPLFQINNDTGVVSLKSSLNREKQSTHHFSIQARDISNSNRIAQADIEIIVTDVNDNPPVFQSAPYEIYITDDQLGDILRIRALDDDEGPNGEVSYRLVSETDTFEIEENTGQISILSMLDTSTLGTSIVLYVEASDRGEPQMSAQTTVTVNIVDSNAPLFTMSGGYSAEVNESASRDTIVITVRADATSTAPQIRYNIRSPQSVNLPFSIDFMAGHVTVNGIGLDYETNSSYRLQLEAIDLSTSLEGRATLDIQVLDVNDNRPEFSMALYHSMVTENSDVGTSVEEVRATDIDSGVNSDIAYFIDPDDIATTFFNIHEDTGLITTSRVIDREQNNFFRFSVFARDFGNPPLTGTTSVQIEVLDLNDNPPTFLESSYYGTISEDDTHGASILFVTATDHDGNSVDYDIVPTQGSSNFAISSGGLLTLTTAASELNEFQYLLNISAYDGDFYGYTQVVIEVEDQNNHPPIFNATTYSAYIIENATIGDYVTQVYATDDDRGSNAEITYSVSSDQFTINPHTGVISVSGELDRESNTNGVTLIVIARDGGGRTGTAEVHIEFGDINDNRPVFSSLIYRFDVLETDPIETTVSTSVVATDPDDGSNGLIRYSISTTDDPNQFPFTINEGTGAITTILAVDPNFQAQYDFTVNAMDMGTPPMIANPSANVTVQVITAGQMPPRLESSFYQINISENNEFAQVLLMTHLVVTNETVQCDIITFSLSQSDENLFGIDHEDDDTSVIIRVYAILDREENPSHTFIIDAVCLPDDSVTEIQSFAPVSVNVLDVNEEPSFSRPFLRGSILEHIALGTILQLEGGINAVEAEDEDSGLNGMIRYSIEDDVPFEVHLISGLITVSGDLDRETEDEYRFDVIATDLGSPQLSDTIRIVVTIEDINDSPPVFEQEVYHAEVSEGVAVNTTVITVTASDADLDEFAINTYSVSGSEAFSINPNTGELIVEGSLDRETKSSYTLTIMATDGLNHVDTILMINITDINDNPPIFNQTQYTIATEENSEVGITLLQVSATDIDLGENADISYGILEDQQLIHVDRYTGEVSFAQTPDYEMSPQGHFEFRVIAMNTNNENMRDLATLIIDLEDVNDNAPQFSDISPVEVSENRPIGTTVVRVVAEDSDSGNNARVVYTLNEEDEEYFMIDSQTGIIQTTAIFDREMNSSFEITITATDSGLPPMSNSTSLLIMVSDENDNAPIFPQNYTFVVLEGAQVGTVIRNIRADDADAGINARIMYRLTGDSSAHFLAFMREDGSVDIIVDQMLNRENIPMYDLSITAFDGGFPFLQVTVSLIIIVQDENDNPPEFESPFYSVQKPENISLGSEITRVHARDPDSAEITEITYSIFNAQSHPQFDIDSFNGRITLVQQLDYESDQSHIIVVQAEDQVHPPATASVIVTVTNINDNAPDFTMPNYTTTVKENTPGKVLFDFTVIDRDIGSNPDTISFRMESGNTDGIFTLNPISGSLSVVDNFDAEALSTSQYLLVITASDNEDPPLTSTAYVTVLVEDVNDNAPVGEDQVIYVFLYNGQLFLNTLGMLLIRDPDRVNEHEFQVTGDRRVFNILEDEGIIDIVQNPPPPGVYSFTVMVTDGSLGSATTQIDITVVNITAAHLANSFTMQVGADTVESFLDNHLQHFLTTIEDLVAEKSHFSNPNVYVLNITPSVDRKGSVDISVVMKSRDGMLIHPNLVQHILHVNRDDVEEKLGLTINTENVDDSCADESTCPLGTICVMSYQYRSSSVIIGSAAASVVGIEQVESHSCSNVTVKCEVPCPEPSYCVQQEGRSVCIDDCSHNPCKNDGKCHEQMPGYYCSCLNGFNGRNCELTTSYFQENSYAVLPAVSTETNGTIVLEFTAPRGAEGLLYYSSRFDDGKKDFIALEIVDDHLSLIVSYGDDSMRVSLMLNGNDWYTAEVEYTSSVSYVTHTLY